MPYEVLSTHQRVRVLCFEQNPADQMAMQDYAWILGWDLLMCREIDQCMQRASDSKFDLIVADLYAGHRPCALEMVKTIRGETVGNAELPALLLSDQPIPEEAMQKVEQTNDAVIREKPLMMSDLKWVAERFISNNIFRW